MYDLEYPHIEPGNQTAQIIDFLWKTIERLNYILGLLSEGSSNSTEKVTGKTFALPFGKVDTSSTSSKYTANVPNINELKDGVCVILSNGTTASTSGFTLNVNGLGAKPVYLPTGVIASNQFGISYTCLFVYNSSRVSGGCWDMY